VRLVHSADEAVEEINQFYSNYHSSRWLKNQFVIRMHHPLSEAALYDMQKVCRLAPEWPVHQQAYSGAEHERQFQPSDAAGVRLQWPGPGPPAGAGGFHQLAGELGQAATHAYHAAGQGGVEGQLKVLAAWGQSGPAFQQCSVIVEIPPAEQAPIISIENHGKPKPGLLGTAARVLRALPGELALPDILQLRCANPPRSHAGPARYQRAQATLAQLFANTRRAVARAGTVADEAFEVTGFTQQPFFGSRSRAGSIISSEAPR
jgi:hypothetical protein